MRTSTSLLCVVLLAATTGCYRTRIDFGGPLAAPAGHATQPPAKHAESGDDKYTDGAFYHNAIFGLVDFSGPLHLRAVCPAGVDYVEQETSFLNGLVRLLTFRLYTPQYVQVFCHGGGSVRLELPPASRQVAEAAGD